MMMSHIIGEAIFDITFGPEKEGTDVESDLARIVQSRLLPIIEEVFDEMALDRETVPIDRLEVDLGPVRDDELESELAARLREKLRDALRDYVLARQKTVVVGRTPATFRAADLEKLAYFLRYGHLTWNTSAGQSHSVVDLLEEALLQSPDQISRLFEGSADFDTVVFRLASQFPENAVQDLIDKLARADPALASRVSETLKIQRRTAAAGPSVQPDEQGVLRAYRLYDRLKQQLTGGQEPAAGDVGSLLEELQRKYPWQLLRLYRELQAGEGLSIRIPAFYGGDDLQRLVEAFLSVVEDTAQSLEDFRQSIQMFARRSRDRKAYYTQVLLRLIRNEVLDLEEISQTSEPVESRAEGDDEDIQTMLSQRPARAREWFRRIAMDPLALHRAIESLPERWLLRLLHLFRESSADRILQSADAVVESAYAAGMNLPYAKVALLKWEFILSSVVSDSRSLEGARFVDELGQLISGDVPQESRERFLSRLHDLPATTTDPAPLSWDALIRVYDLYDLVLQKLGTKGQVPGEVASTLQELLEKYPLHVRRLYREVQSDMGLLTRIQQMHSPEDLAGLIEVFLTVLDLDRERVFSVLEAIARGAALSQDRGLYYGQVLQRLLRTPDVVVETLVAEPSVEESDEQVFEGMRLLLAGRATRESDLVQRFEAILRDRPERAQRWLLEALSSEQATERAVQLLSERALLDVFRQLGGGRMAVLIRTADAVADSLLAERSSISERELFRLKWTFLFTHAVQKKFEFQPEVFSAEFARYLEERVLPVSERVRRIQLRLWDRSQPLDERFLVETLRSFEIPAVGRLLLEADTVAHAFYREGLALPQTEIARLKWQMIFSDALLEEADQHASEFAGHFEALLRGRLADAESGDLPVAALPVPQDLSWSGWIRAYELYDLLRRALVDGKPYGASGLMAALEETLRLHPWQLLRLYREMRAGDGISVRVRDLYGVDELRRLAEALLTLSAEDAETASGIRKALAALEPRESKDGDRRAYYFGVLEQLVQTGRPPDLAAQFASVSLPEKVRWVQARLRDRSLPLPERFLVQVLSELDSPGVEQLLQTADSVVDSYYRAGVALPDREIGRLKWEMIFSDALVEEPETHAAEFAEHLQTLFLGRLDALGVPVSSGSLRVPVSAEFDWTSWVRAYELYDRLRRTLVDGEPDSAPGLVTDLEETLRLYPSQLLRLYREMQAGDGISVHLKDAYPAEELRRVAEAVLSVSEQHPTAAIAAMAAFEPGAQDLRLYYQDVLERLIQARQLPAPVTEFLVASLPEKVRRIQARLRDRLQPLPEPLMVHILSEIESPAIDRLLRTADSVADAYYRAAVVLPQREIARLKWQLIFSDALLEEPEQHAVEFEENFRLLVNERVSSVEEVHPQILPSFEAGWSAWVRAYELYDRLRRVLVEGRPDSPSGLMAVLEETLRLHPWQLLRLYREMQAGDGLSARVKVLYGAGELQRIVEAFLTVSEEASGVFDRLKDSIAALGQQTKDPRLYYAAVLQQLVRAEVIDLELALKVSGEEQPAVPAPGLPELEASASSDEWQDLVRSYDLYEDLRRALLGAGAVRVAVKDLVEQLAQSYPWQIQRLYRELESTELQAGILRSRDPDALRSLIEAFVRTVSLGAPLAAAIKKELETGEQGDALQRYASLLEGLIRSRVTETETRVTLPLLPLPPQPSPQLDESGELIRVAEDMLRSGVERLRRWIEEMLSTTAAAERLVRLLPEGLIARIFVTGASASSPALLLVTAERLAMAASSPKVGISPRRARELKWMFILRYGLVERRSFVESEFVRSFAASIHAETQLPSAEGLASVLTAQMSGDGMPLLVRQVEDKTYGAIELERGISVMNAGMVLAGPYLPRLFAELNLTEGRKFRDDEARGRAVHILQFMVNESEDTEEHELVLNKILCGMDTAAPIQRRIELVDREKVMVESLIRGMILNWKKLGQTSVAGFRESFLQREGTLRLTDDTWRLEVIPKAFDVLLDHIPWTFETIKHPWMERIVHVQWQWR